MDRSNRSKHALCLLLSAGASAFSASSDADVVRSFTLFEISDGRENSRGKCVGRCIEVSPSPLDPDAIEEDEVEMFYQTNRRSFLFPNNGWEDSTEAERLLLADSIHPKALNIRQTSFGCGRLGATIWPSGIALASLIAGDSRSLVQGRRVLELGSGCGLPSLVARDVCAAEDICATDYWEEEDGKFDGDRLVPKNLFGANLAYNLGSNDNVKRLDWHDELGIILAADEFQPDTIIGSDLVYYPMDTSPLLNTLNIMLKTSAQNALLLLPLPPFAEREALPEFRSRIGEEMKHCIVKMDELEMVGRGDEDRHNLLRIHVCPCDNEYVRE